MRQARRSQIKRYFCWSVVICVTLAAACLNSIDRDLNLLDGPNPPFVAFAKAVCLADSIVAGMSISLVLLKLGVYFRLTEQDLKAALENVAGIFVIYSVIVGTGMCLYDFKAVTRSQLFEYFCAITVNWKYVTVFLNSDR